MDPIIESPSGSESNVQHCAACGEPIDVTGFEPLETVGCPACGADVVVVWELDCFVLEAVAGRGGMGVVYRALDQQLHRRVAIKLLKRSHSADAEQIALLSTEAAITASINHPHVVRVYSTGVARGQFYIAMELVSKGSLDDLIRTQGRVAEAQVLEVAIQIASGLDAAHARGLIHRDIKPGNILFSDVHTAKIVDFGLAIFMSNEQDVGGDIWGTPYYVAPEKLERKPEDLRSDIYSLGATLFHALAGRPPFEAPDASQVAYKHLHSKPASLQAFAPDVSSRTAYIINRTLAKDPAERYQTYGELIEHLTYARNELQVGSVQVRNTQRVVLESAQDNKAWGLVVMGLLAVTIAGLVAFFVYVGRSKKSEDEPVERPVAAVETPRPASSPKKAETPRPAPVAVVKPVTPVTPAPVAAATPSPKAVVKVVATPVTAPASELKITGNSVGSWQGALINPGAWSAKAEWQSGVLKLDVAGGEASHMVDSMPLIYQKVTGNFELSALITAVASAQGKGRVILTARQNLGAGAAHASIALFSTLEIYHTRRNTEGMSTFPGSGPVQTLPVWLKLVRTGMEFDLLTSTDGSTWKSVLKRPIQNTPAELLVGLSAVAGPGGKFSATVERVEIKRLP